MAIAFDAATNGGNATATSLTFAHTCGASADLLVVGVIGDEDTGFDDITGVTYDGVSMTLATKRVGGVLDRNTYLYYLLAPGTGSAKNVVVSATNSHFLFGCAASYSGVQQSGQPDATAASDSGGAATTYTSSITSVADNCWAVFMHGGYQADAAPTAGTGLTRRAYDATFGTGGLFDSGVITPAGSHSGTTEYPTVGATICHVKATFAPTVASSGHPASKRMGDVSWARGDSGAAWSPRRF